jgi:hypothetical protein
MAIPVQCEHCNKKYNAPDSMAGKRIKCRGCGKIVAIPALDEGPDLSVLESLEGNGAGAAGVDAEMLTGSSASGSRVTGAVRPGTGSGKGIAHTMKRGGDVAEIAVAAGDDHSILRRPSVPFVFPGAAVLDNIAPLALIVLGLGWLALMAVNSNDTPVGWVGMLRLGLYVLLYVALAFPLCYASIKWAARKCRVMLPPGAALRAFGAFALPFAMAFAFWLSSQSAVMLILGMIIGAIIVGGAVWFLFRVQPYEMSTTLGGATGAYAASVVSSYLILLGVNLLLGVLMRGGDVELERSPVAPGLAWEPIRKEVKPRKVAIKTTDKIEAGAVATTQPTTSTAGTTQPATSEQTNMAKTGGTGTDSTGQATVDTKPGNPGTTAVASTDVKPSPGNDVVATTPETKPGTATKPKPAAPPAPSSPLVAEATAANLGDHSDVLYPAMPSNFMAVIRSKTDGAEDVIEQWTINPLEKKQEKQFRRDKDLFAGYVLSPGGDLVARVSSWPRIMIEVYSFSAGKVVKEFPFDGSLPGAPRGGAALAPAALGNVKIRLLGFGVNDNLIVYWTTGGSGYVDVLRTKGGGNAQLTSFEVPAVEEASGNPSISPDGTKLALAALVKGEGGIDIYEIGLVRPQSQLMKTFAIEIHPWVKPVGLAWNPNKQGVAAFWDDGQGRGLLVDYKMAGDPRKPAHLHRYETAPYPAQTPQTYGKGRTFDWLPDGAGWLMFGQYLIDVDTGKLLGDLGAAEVKSQQVLDKEQVIVHWAVEGGARDAYVVKLKTDAIAAKRSELKKGAGAAASIR